MIFKFQMLLDDEYLKRKYARALSRSRDEVGLHNCAYVVQVDEDIVRLRPLFSYQCGVEEWIWHSVYNVVEHRKNEPFQNELQIMQSDADVHLIISTLMKGTLDYDHFVKGLKLLCNFQKPPAKYIKNYLTDGFVFRGLGTGSYDENISCGEFVASWVQELQLDLYYKEIELTTPSSIVGRLRSS